MLTLSGVARVFNTKRQLLLTLGDFPRAWSLLLEFIEHSALNKNNEVSLAALKSFQEVLYVNKGKAEDAAAITPSEEAGVWGVAWRVWLSIGAESTAPAQGQGQGQGLPEDVYVPSQAFLAALIQIFPAVFQHIRATFTTADLERLCAVLQNMVTVPVQGDASVFVLPSDAALTPLQEGVVHCARLLQEEALSLDNMSTMVPALFRQLLWFSRLACQRASPVNFVPFGEKMLTAVVSLYEKTGHEQAVIEADVLHQVIDTLHLPLSLKYSCPAASTWKLAVTCLLAVLHKGLPLARKQPAHFASMWPSLADTLDHFLFPADPPPSEDALADEAVDCQVSQTVDFT